MEWFLILVVGFYILAKLAFNSNNSSKQPVNNATSYRQVYSDKKYDELLSAKSDEILSEPEGERDFKKLLELPKGCVQDARFEEVCKTIFRFC